jgi:hypothetical protein
MYLDCTSSNLISAQQRAGHFEMQDTQFKKKIIKKTKILLWHHWVSWEKLK